MNSVVLIAAKEGDAEAAQAANDLSKWLKRRSMRGIDVSAGRGQIPVSVLKKAVAGVSFGGDGTLLSLVDRLPKKDAFPLVGVNLGTLGFITSVAKTEIRSVLQRVFAGEATEERRGLFAVSVSRGQGEVYSGVFLNDAVILKGGLSALIHLELRVDGALLSRLRADGFIISSSTGSTAYALSAGGPLVHPAADVVLLVPLMAHALASRPVLLPSSASPEVTLLDHSADAMLVIDGQRKFALKVGDKLVASPFGSKLRLIGGSTEQWTQALRSKLGVR